jgi:glycine oxidase
MAEIHIAGAGILGLWQAAVLSREGHSVTVWDPGGFPSGGSASRLAGAMLGPFCEGEAGHESVRDLGVEALELWRDFYPQTVLNGTLVVATARDRADLDRYKRVSIGYRTVDAAGIADLEPALADRFPHGLFYADEGHVDPNAAMAALAKLATGAGARLNAAAYPENEPSGWLVDSRGYKAHTALKSLRGVRGERLVISCPEVMLTRPVRLLHPRIPFYIVPWGDGRYMIGASVIESSDSGPPSVRTALELLGACISLNPAFAEARILDLAAGIRPAFSDNLPKAVVRGETIHVNGSHRHGFLLAPVLARAVAAYIRDGERDERLIVEDRGEW